MKIYYVFFLLIALFVITSCDEKRLFEKIVDLPGNDWYADSTVDFSFDIQETNIQYNLLLNVRNAVSYPFANLYITYYLINPAGKVVEEKLLRLPLFDKKTGKPFGDGLGDIFDHQFPILKNHKFLKEGTYKIKIKQYMRQDPLPFIMAIGVRVEK